MLRKILKVIEIITTTLLALIESGVVAFMFWAIFYMSFIDTTTMSILMPLWLRIIVFLFFTVIWLLTFYPVYKDEMRKIRK